jgi:hypothetical protein
VVCFERDVEIRFEEEMFFFFLKKKKTNRKLTMLKSIKRHM